MCPGYGEIAGAKRYCGSNQIWLAKRIRIFPFNFLLFGKKWIFFKIRGRILRGVTFLLPFLLFYSSFFLFLQPLSMREEDTISALFKLPDHVKCMAMTGTVPFSWQSLQTLTWLALQPVLLLPRCLLPSEAEGEQALIWANNPAIHTIQFKG